MTEASSVIKTYGDLMDDGAIQLSFTLPVAKSDKAREAAKKMAEQMGLSDVKILHMESIDKEFTFFVVYATCNVTVDMDQIEVPVLEYPQLEFNDINKTLQNELKQPLTVLGACIGTDAHTVGIDAIFNMKGYMGNYGLERYPMFNAINLRAQVDVNDLAKQVVDKKADVVMVSRVVTQRDSHVEEFKKFLAALNELEGVNPKLIKICGGPRVTHKEAKEWGFDAGFGPGTLPSHVASYVAHEVLKRRG